MQEFRIHSFFTPWSARAAALLAPLLLLGLGCDRRRKLPAPLAAPVPSMTPDPAPTVLAVLPGPDPAHIPDVSNWQIVGGVRRSFAGPHRGTFRRVTLNPIAATALERGNYRPWPDGTQMVKEALDAKGRRLGFFWMSKEQGQWVWATGDVKGRVAARFLGDSSGACAACHTARAARFDGSFAPALAGKESLDLQLDGEAPPP